mgnify:CR=1 FL=1|jgi:predicted phage tail protein
MSPTTTKGSFVQRDSDSLRVLGFFFLVLGCMVLIGTFWTMGNLRGLIVNLGSGLILTSVGGVMLRIARRLARQQPNSNEASQTTEVVD